MSLDVVSLVFALLVGVVLAIWVKLRGGSPQQAVRDQLRTSRLVSIALALGFLVYAVATGSTIAFVGGLVWVVVAAGDDFVYRSWR